MKNEDKIKLSEARLELLTNSEKENYGICRKIQREIRNLRKKVDE